jgi:hypothetical protein
MLSVFYTNSPLLLTNSPLPLSWEERGKAVEDGALCSIILLFICFAFQFLTYPDFFDLPPFSREGRGGFVSVGERICNSGHFNKHSYYQ